MSLLPSERMFKKLNEMCVERGITPPKNFVNSAVMEEPEDIELAFAEGFFSNALDDMKIDLRDFEEGLSTHGISLPAKSIMVVRNLTSLTAKDRAVANIINSLFRNGIITSRYFKEFMLSIAWNDGKSAVSPLIDMTNGILDRTIKYIKGFNDIPSMIFPVSQTIETAMSVINDVANENDLQEHPIIQEIEASMKQGARWFEVADIGASPSFSSKASSLNLMIGNFTESNDAVFLDSEKSIITLAAPGSGKTQCHVLPALNQYKGSAIVLDIKGECFLNSARWRNENVGKVFAFAPANPNASKKYNPLSFISTDHDQVWEDARLLAEMLIIPKSKSDPTWETQGRQFLTLLIAYVAHEEDNKRNMASILNLINDLGLNEALDDILGEGAPFPSSMIRTANKFQKMRETAEKQFQGVLSGASQHLTVWEGSAIEKVTASSDWSPKDFRKSPITLYLVVPPNAIDTYAPLLRVIIGQHVRELMREEPDREAPPILFMLDELPRLGNMAPIREALEVGRSYGIKLWMFAQFAGQLREAYGKDIADGMIESCGARIYMNAGADTAEKLAKVLGTRENLLTGKTEPVVTPQELMGPEWRDDMLVFATGEPPLRLKKVFFHEQAAADTTN